MILAGVGSAGACDSAGETAIKDALRYFLAYRVRWLGVVAKGGGAWRACVRGRKPHSSPLL